MKRILFQILLISISIQLFSKEIDMATAEQVAKNFLGTTTLKSSRLIELKLLPEITPNQYPHNNFKSRTVGMPYYYLFNVNENEGFILISGDDCAFPVLGYSNQGGIIIDSLPPAFIKWIEQYKNEIRLLRKHKIQQSEMVKEKWEALKSTSKLKSCQDISSVGPLITTKWDQSPYYNNMCPRKYFWNDRAATGCVATAMAQIMKYFNHPTHGIGFKSYYHSNNFVTYGTLSANFGATTYDWKNMPIYLNSGSSSTQINAVAELMYHCGVSIEMDYHCTKDGQSFASTKEVANALVEYFQYDEGIEYITMQDYYETYGESVFDEWIKVLKNELDNSRPMQYRGSAQEGGGHSFVCDGYDSQDRFHFNWGWGGLADGYYSLTSLIPTATGIGAGFGEYTNGQSAIIGIKPKIGTNYNLDLYSSITTTPSPIKQIFEFDVKVDILNSGLNNFSGDFCAALFSEDGIFIDYIEILTGYNLKSGYHYTNGLSFHSDGLSVYPGTYKIGVFYRVPESNWISINNGNYLNFKSFSIVSPFPENDIKLYDSININPDPIVQGNSLNVWADIANYGSTTYNGTFAAALYKINGELSEIIEIDSTISLDAGYHYTNGINFSSTEIVSEPGSYMIAIVDVPNGSSNAFLVDPNTYLNPIFVNVTAPPLQPDIYEVNNSEYSPYNLDVSFLSDSTHFSTTGANLHVSEDIDYYKISLPQGFQYTINARLHDSYNSNNGNEYTCDVFLTYQDGTGWSEIFDDLVFEDIVINNGGDLIFSVAPFFQGNIGTYDLEFTIKRGVITSKEIFSNPELKIYPNPFNDYVIIENKNNNIKKIELIDASGKSILSHENNSKTWKLNTLDFSSGVYFIKVFTTDEAYIQKLIKNE